MRPDKNQNQLWDKDSLKKKLTADERRYTQKNQELDENTGLTNKVVDFFDLSLGFIGVHPFLSAVNSRL